MASPAGKAAFAKFCFAPKVGSPLDKVLGLIQGMRCSLVLRPLSMRVEVACHTKLNARPDAAASVMRMEVLFSFHSTAFSSRPPLPPPPPLLPAAERLDTLSVEAASATNSAQAAQAAVVTLSASLAAYTALVNGCTAYSTGFPEYQACATSPGLCNPSANITCGTGFQCTAFNPPPTAAGAPTGYCTAIPPTAAEVCAAGDGTPCPATNVCFLTSADPPPTFSSCGGALCTNDTDCVGNYTCQSAQDPALGAPVAYPTDAMTCQPPTAAQVCAANCQPTDVCYLAAGGPPAQFDSCGDAVCTPATICPSVYECKDAQDPTPGAPTAYPVGVQTCQQMT